MDAGSTRLPTPESLEHPCSTSRHAPLRSAAVKGTTLIELMIVIGVIALLLAILLPSLARARRSALVLASPIAYIAKDGSLWVCGPQGEHQLRACDLTGLYGSVKWSPLGTRIACNYDSRIAVIEPVSGRVDLLPKEYQWPIWTDSDRILAQYQYGGGDYDLDLYKVKVGPKTESAALFKSLKRENLPWGQVNGQYFANGLMEGYVITEAPYNSSPATNIVIRDKLWNRTKIIWWDGRSSDGFGNTMDLEPRIDAFGEYVGWSRGRSEGDVVPFSVAFKSMSASTSDPPTVIGGEYESVWFCDWAPDNNLLAVVTQGKQSDLVLMNRQGHIMRTIPTPGGMNPARAFSPAAWKRYEHR